MSLEVNQSFVSSQGTVRGNESREERGDVPAELVIFNGAVMYTSNTAQTFVDWWITTEWGVGVAEENPEFPDPNWESDQRRRTDVWEQFEQGARRENGEPMVLCLGCDMVLSHPNNKRAGSGNLGKHLKSTRCRKSAATRQLHPVMARLQRAVSVPFKIIFIILPNLLSILSLTIELFFEIFRHSNPQRNGLHKTLGSCR